MQNLFYLQVTFEQKRPFTSIRAFPDFKQSIGRYTLISKMFSVKNVSGFLFGESEPGACSLK